MSEEMKFEIGDRVEVINDKYISNGVAFGDEGVVVALYDYGMLSGNIGVRLDKDICGNNLGGSIVSNDGLWISSKDIKITQGGRLPTKLYQLYEYYSHEKNRNDEFIYKDDRIVRYDGGDIITQVNGREAIELYEVECLSNMFTIEIKPFYENQDVKELTLEEIKEELGFDFKIVSSEYREVSNKHE